MLTFQELIPGCVRASEFAPFYLVFDDGKRRLATDQEVAAVRAAQQEEQAKRQESDTARDDTKRALAALDTIIANAPSATTAQLRTAAEQLARIAKHHILATLGR